MAQLGGAMTGQEELGAPFRMITKTCFLTEEKHAIRVQNLRDHVRI
jgi:hypothetical protein